MPDKTDFYRRLNIGTGASEEAIKKAYRLAVKKTHPDVNKNDGATQHFLDIQEAYQILSHPDKKDAYDMGREPEGISTNIHTAREFSQSALLRLDEPQVIYSLVDIISSEDDKALSILFIVSTAFDLSWRTLFLNPKMSRKATILLSYLRPTELTAFLLIYILR